VIRDPTKYGKDHLCSACERGKSKKASHPPKLVLSDHSKLELLHMDLCGPMRVYFLCSKDETPEIIKKFIAQSQLNYKAKVCKIRTDNGTEFKNTSLNAHYENLGIMQQFSIARTPQQNGVVERCNRTLVEAARTMLIFSRLPEFLWAEAVATACFTQNWRANDCLVSITEPDYKNLNKNDIEDIYLLIMNGKVPDYADTGLLWSLSVFIRSSVIWERVHDFQLGIESYQQKVNLTVPTITFPGVKDHEMFSIIYEPLHGIIYKNSKKEKWVMRHSKIYKFCDATLNRVLEGLKSYNNDVKYGYVQKDLTKDETEYLKLFEEEIEASKADENMGDVREWKTTWIKNRMP
ncbi:retrovirus-related pol polyprotein from transposon TNT 1-94, partial [Tanacetum coccineum]